MVRMPSYRPLERPAPPDHTDKNDLERYQRENAQWWENWAHNFTLSLDLLLVAALTLIALVILGGIIATICHG